MKNLQKTNNQTEQVQFQEKYNYRKKRMLIFVYFLTSYSMIAVIYISQFISSFNGVVGRLLFAIIFKKILLLVWSIYFWKKIFKNDKQIWLTVFSLISPVIVSAFMIYFIRSKKGEYFLSPQEALETKRIQQPVLSPQETPERFSSFKRIQEPVLSVLGLFFFFATIYCFFMAAMSGVGNQSIIMLCCSAILGIFFLITLFVLIIGNIKDFIKRR